MNSWAGAGQHWPTSLTLNDDGVFDKLCDSNEDLEEHLQKYNK